MSLFQKFIYVRAYSRYIEEESRREEWTETVDRYESFFSKRVPEDKQEDFYDVITAILDQEVMPSMRALWAAGPALERDNIAGYNCAYLTISHIKAFADLMYILMNGTGVGYSVEREYVKQLPVIPDELVDVDTTIVFADSKRGWAQGLYDMLKHLYKGEIPKYDFSKIRPKGARLKIFGGRASGPEPLEELILFTIQLFKKAAGQRLTTIECHDLCCFIASCIVVGGVRRSACVSLSNLSDTRMAQAKMGDFHITNPQRALANNSVAYTSKPDSLAFIEEFANLIKSQAGERGIFNREGSQLFVSQIGRRDHERDFGINPCGEIILRPEEFCNLSEVIVRESDSKADLLKKVQQATILGVLQSTLTDFKFIGKNWESNNKEERLLGVSLSGTRDHKILGKVSKTAALWLNEMKLTAIETAKEWSTALGINMPAAITCIKPSGTVSQLVDCAPGLHTRYSPYYLRRVRVSTTNPLCTYLIDKGMVWEPENGQHKDNCNIVVFSFPVASPKQAVLREDVSAIDQLDYWLMMKVHWCEHNPSVTIQVHPSEWVEVAAWVYRNWTQVGGLAFLPYDTGLYRLAPYQEITEDEYTQYFIDNPALKTLDFSELPLYETEDQTEGSSELACVGESCEI